MFKICIWMNMPSHHQSAFFTALDDRDDVDLRVIYLNETLPSRATEGWSRKLDLQPFESFALLNCDPEEIVEALPDWMARIQIISGTFCAGLVDLFCRQNVPWCHWSEMPGYRLAGMLDHRLSLFRLLNPIMLACKRREGARIRTHALGAFAQGVLARRAFRLMGVPHGMMADLYYAPAALPDSEPCESIVSFAAGRKVFLSVGALCRRKGIDLLLKAFARMDARGWCLVICGLDRAPGVYQKLAHRLGIAERVLFLGAYPVDRIAEVYAAADVLVLSSRFDGWGAVLNEAASAGLPLIGTDLCGSAWHLIEEERNGYRVKAGSVAGLAGAMQMYAADPALVAAHGAASRARFYGKFSPEKNAKRLVDALRKWTDQ